MTKVFFTTIMLFCLSKGLFAQNVTCGQVVSQLQIYAAQVNQFYQNEYWQVIPNIRCPAYNQWGQPFHPQIVQNCRWQMLSYLNQWYGMQSQYVNNWYAQIVRGCSVEPPTTQIEGPGPKKKIGDEENEEIDTDQLEEITAGIDEDKVTPIRIPKTPSGYRPNK